MTSFYFITIVLLSIFLAPKQSEGQYLPVVMHPNEDDRVLVVGATLNFTCTVETNIYSYIYLSRKPHSTYRGRYPTI